MTCRPKGSPWAAASLLLYLFWTFSGVLARIGPSSAPPPSPGQTFDLRSEIPYSPSPTNSQQHTIDSLKLQGYDDSEVESDPNPFHQPSVTNDSSNASNCGLEDDYFTTDVLIAGGTLLSKPPPPSPLLLSEDEGLFPPKQSSKSEVDFDASDSTERAYTSRKAEKCDGCIGGDDRVQVNDTETYPYSTIKELSLVLGGQDTTCTGVIVSPRHVLTAAHCIYDHSTASFFHSLHVQPGSKDSTNDTNNQSVDQSFPTWSHVRTLRAFITQPDYNSVAANYDFALVTLEGMVPSHMGHMGLESVDTVLMTPLSTSGFPEDKPSDTMWTSVCPETPMDLTEPCFNRAIHFCDSTFGQSGAPIYDSSMYVRAVLTGGSGENNWATGVTPFVYNTLARWFLEDTKP